MAPVNGQPNQSQNTQSQAGTPDKNDGNPNVPKTNDPNKPTGGEKPPKTKTEPKPDKPADTTGKTDKSNKKSDKEANIVKETMGQVYKLAEMFGLKMGNKETSPTIMYLSFGVGVFVFIVCAILCCCGCCLVAGLIYKWMGKGGSTPKTVLVRTPNGATSRVSAISGFRSTAGSAIGSAIRSGTPSRYRSQV